MGLQDFWDNIRTPGFVETMFEELADMCNGAKKEIISLMEEGEEVFIDGFQDMVINKNPDYKNSVQKIDGAKGLVEEIRSQLLEARGFNNVFLARTLDTIGRTVNHAATALSNLDRATINEITATLKNEYKNLPISTPEELVSFSNQICDIVRLPDAPQYTRPYSDSEVTFLDANLRKQRVVAADEFMVKAKEYEGMMQLELARQKEYGIIFDAEKISDELNEIIEGYESQLAIENILLKYLGGDNEELDENDLISVRLSILIASGIRRIICVALDTTNSTNSTLITDELKVDLISVQNELGKHESIYGLTPMSIAGMDEKVSESNLSSHNEELDRKMN